MPIGFGMQVIEKVRWYFGSNFRWSGLQQPGSRLFLRQRKRFLLRSPLKRRKLHTGTGMRSIHPLWTKVATADQVKAMLPLLTDTAKFSTYIPFPTVAADHPKYNPRGYWRGPIWLDGLTSLSAACAIMDITR